MYSHPQRYLSWNGRTPQSGGQDPAKTGSCVCISWLSQLICGRWLHVIRYMSIHVILACMNRAVRAVLSLDATAWRSPALCVRLESAANDVLRDPVPLPAPPRLLPPFCFCVCVCLSFCPSRVRVIRYLPHRTGARDPHPLRHQRYLSPLPCRPLRIRTLRTSPPPRAFSPQSAPPPAERHPVSNKALLSKIPANEVPTNPSKSRSPDKPEVLVPCFPS